MPEEEIGQIGALDISQVVAAGLGVVQAKLLQVLSEVEVVDFLTGRLAAETDCLGWVDVGRVGGVEVVDAVGAGLLLV